MSLDVMFRKDKKTGDVVAYFPYVIWSKMDATCLVRDEGHGACSHRYIVNNTVPCDDYEPLKRYMEDELGYENIKVIKKRNYVKYIKAVGL